MKGTTVGLLTCAVALILSGCAGLKPQLSPELQKEYDAPVYCEGEEACTLMWERAAFFVTSNAGFKLQMHTNTLIETYNPTKHSPQLAFRIRREPLGNGRYQIWTQAWCANFLGCQPNQHEAVARANRYMRTGQM